MADSAPLVSKIREEIETAKPTFVYFGAAGRVETAKLCALLAGIEFGEEVVTFPQWKGRKMESLWGSLPYVEFPEGTRIGQSRCLARYYAKRAKLYPTDPVLAAKVDAVYDYLEDIQGGIFKKTAEMGDDEYKQAREQQWGEGGAVSDMLGRLNKFMEANGENGFAVGKCLTMADIAAFVYLNNLVSGFWDHVPGPEAYEKYSCIQAVRAKVYNLSKIKQRYESAFPGSDGNMYTMFKNVISKSLPEESESEYTPGTWEKIEVKISKLTYFNAPGRAEISRLIMALGGTEFEDERMSGPDQWTELKDKNIIPLGGKVPCMTLSDETILTESAAIMRFAGKMSGLYPEDDIDALHVDQVLNAIADVGVKCYPVKNNQSAYMKLWEPKGTVGLIMEKLEAYLKNTPIEWKEQLVACAGIFVLVQSQPVFDGGNVIFGEYPTFYAIYESMCNNDKLKKYYEGKDFFTAQKA